MKKKGIFHQFSFMSLQKNNHCETISVKIYKGGEYDSFLVL